MKRHAETEHGEEFQKAKIAKPEESIKQHFVPTKPTPSLTPSEVATMICCSQHVLPLNWAEHPIVRGTFGFTHSAKIVWSENTQLYQKYRKDVQIQLKDSTVTLALDGWKNAVTGNENLSFTLWLFTTYNNISGAVLLGCRILRLILRNVFKK